MPSPTVYPAVVNDWGRTVAAPWTLGANYAIGDDELILEAGAGAALAAAMVRDGYGSVSPTCPVWVVVRPEDYVDSDQTVIFQATSLVGDVLSGLTMVGGWTDQDFPAGSTVEVLVTAEVWALITGAVNALISGLDEAIDDRVGALLVAGSGITLNYDDTSGTLVITAAGGGGSYQPLDADLTDIAAVAPTKGRILVGDGTHWQPLGVGTDTHVLTSDAAQSLGIKWSAPSGGGGAPGGATTLIQYNNNGSFGGVAGFSFDGTVLAWSGGMVIGAAAALGGYVPGSHEVQVVSSGNRTPLVLVGGSAVVEIWKDATPSAVCAFGMAVPGNAAGNDFVFSVNPTVGAWGQALRLTGARSVHAGVASLATNATDGFLYIPASAGPPTGAPSSVTGMVPIHYDSTNNHWYVYNGSWRKVALT